MAEEELTTQPQAQPAVPAAPSPPSTAEIVAEILGDMPALSVVRPYVEVVATCFAAYAATGVTDRNGALTQLAILNGWNEELIGSALESVMSAVAEQFLALSERFAQTTGSAVEATDFDAIAARYDAEKQEQAELTAFANRLIKVVGELSASLGITNPDPGLRLPAEQAPAPKPRFLQRIGATFVVQKPAQEIPTKPKGGWTTPPVINDQDAGIQRLLLIDSQRANFGDPAGLLAWLGNIGFDRGKLENLMRDVANQARQQLEQSDAIIGRARDDFAGFQRELDALQGVRQIVLVVDEFFFGEETAPA